jgi:hypothetical protein
MGIGFPPVHVMIRWPPIWGLGVRLLSGAPTFSIIQILHTGISERPIAFAELMRTSRARMPPFWR